MSYPILTPISKTKITHELHQQGKACSRRDYEEQCERNKKGLEIMWDDAKGNPTKEPGGIFAFVDNYNKVFIHKIQKIMHIEDRLISWARNVGHGDRNVLVLSPQICEIQWDVWSKTLEITKWREMGTRRIADEKKALLLENYVNEYSKYDYIQETGEYITRMNL